MLMNTHTHWMDVWKGESARTFAQSIEIEEDDEEDSEADDNRCNEDADDSVKEEEEEEEEEEQEEEEEEEDDCDDFEDDEYPVRFCFRNFCETPLLLCWIDCDGCPHHFYKLKPIPKPISMATAPAVDDNLVTTELITEDDRIEYSHVGHAFVIAAATSDSDFAAVRRRKALIQDKTHIIGGLRARKSGIYLVEIRPKHTSSSRSNNDLSSSSNNNEIHNYDMIVTKGKFEPNPIDTTETKQYFPVTLGGWPVQLDADLSVSDPRLRILELDLQVLGKCLPTRAKDQLIQSTPLWINESFEYGPKVCPVRLTSCCFHPDVNWLIQKGCHADKQKCVELYDLDNYLEARVLWQPGGLLLHEFSHAYHHKCLPGQYENESIERCYRNAVHNKHHENLYANVPVHSSPEGPNTTARAYACQDAMEYFAELSTAFLGGLDKDVEFNKWFPFNRSQLEQHDPTAFAMLQDVWEVDLSNQKEKDAEGEGSSS